MRRKTPRPIHHAADFNLDVLSSEDDLFRWFLLSFLFGKPIQSTVAARTWQLFISRKLDTPWAILDASHRTLVRLLDEGKYTRYDEVTARRNNDDLPKIYQHTAVERKKHEDAVFGAAFDLAIDNASLHFISVLSQWTRSLLAFAKALQRMR